MKINKTNPKHLTALAISIVNTCFVIIARPFFKNRKHNRKIVIFYGHTLNGNLKAFLDFLNKKEGNSAYYLTLDKNYYKRLKDDTNNSNQILSVLSLKDMMVVAKCDAIITSHGLHFLSILRLTSIKFIDVWHAVSYKGFDKDDFKLHRTYDEVWVSSDDMRKMYIEKYGFSPKKVKTTGYARTDQLVNNSKKINEIEQKYSIPKARKYILFAPTWQQDVPGRSILPFGMDETTFFNELDKLAGENSAHLIFRTHLNSSNEINVKNLKHTSFMPYGKYEVVEDFLFIADILVTDWSSIGIDYLPLKRPTIFLDVPAPFRNGFNLGPEHRFGDVVSDLESLKVTLTKYLLKPQEFVATHSKEIKFTTRVAYGDTLDGQSTQRYYNNLIKLL